MEQVWQVWRTFTGNVKSFFTQPQEYVKCRRTRRYRGEGLREISHSRDSRPWCRVSGDIGFVGRNTDRASSTSYYLTYEREFEKEREVTLFFGLRKTRQRRKKSVYPLRANKDSGITKSEYNNRKLWFNRHCGRFETRTNPKERSLIPLVVPCVYKGTSTKVD